MPNESSATLGAYLPGDSLLHRFDPRLKLVLLLGTIACLFSASGGWRLLPIFLLWLGSSLFCGRGVRDSFRLIYLLRWLLLFSLLLHLFFTPGRTLFGTGWLSYDGLLRGLLVTTQILLAILWSQLLAWSTRPKELAWGLTRLLAPLQRFKVPVRETGDLLVLVLHFFPMIQQELKQLQQAQVVRQKGLLKRLQALAELIGPLLLRLLDKADLLAQNIVAGRESFNDMVVARETTYSRSDLLLFFAGLGLLCLFWMI